MKSFVLSFFVFILALQISIAQPANISFQHYTTENGLSSNLVRQVVQDKYGFIWIGTTDGLNRFDGKTFTVYRYNRKDSASLNNNIINGLSTDSTGKIWVATNSGLCYYDYADDAFHHIDISRKNYETIDPRRVHAVSAGKNNRTWYITRTELHVLNADGSVETYPVNRDAFGEINSLLASNDRIWIGTNRRKLLLFNQKDRQFKSYDVFRNKNSKTDRTISVVEIFQSGSDELLAGTWYAGLQRITVSGPDVKIIAYDDEQEKDDRKWIVTGITKSNDATDHFWISHFGTGISLVDISSGRFLVNKHHDPADAKSLCNDFVNTLFKDAAGTLWVGTNEGLDKYDELANRFSWHIIPEFNQSGTVRRQPSDILENRNDSTRQTLWIGVASAGLFLYSRTDQSVKSFQHNPHENNSLLSNDVYALYMTADGKLWIGTREGVCTYEEKKNVFKIIPVDSSSLTPKFISAILEDSKHRFWFASFRNGVYCYYPGANKVILYEHNDSIPQSLPDNHVFCILEDHERRIWAGTQNNGLSRLDETTSSWTHFKHKPGTTNTIPENYIYALFEDELHQLWIATENGLGVMNLETEEVKSFSTADGLCNNDIFSFRKTSNNHLWLATTNGLSDYDISNKTFRNYFTMDGLPTNDLGGAFSSMSDETIYIGVPGGIVFFNPTSIKANTKVPSVVITSFSVFDKKYPVRRKGIQLEPIKLSYRQNMITFGFAALSFTNPANNMYAYKLEGFDKNWINCGNKTSATYTNLDGGDYIFKVKACNNDGVWNEAGTTALLFITPPFWKTWWFYFMVSIVTGIILYLIYRVRISQILRLQHIRQRIARDLHDDIGSTLSSISMMSKMAAVSESGVKEKSTELFSTIGKASTQAMDLMSDIVWAVNPENDKIENVVTRMREYASVILDAVNISFKIETDEAVQRIFLPMEKRKDFFLIFKEAVNNLAKYSHAGNAQIKLSVNNHILTLLIKDNGNGFHADKIFSGNGIKNMKVRASQLDAKFEISSQQGNGTIISLSVPLVP